jgi:hypothetical protein
VIHKKLDQLADLQQKPLEKNTLSPQGIQPLKIGDRVYVRSLKVDGKVQSIGQDTVEVEIGKMRVKVSAPIFPARRSKRKRSGQKARMSVPPNFLFRPQSHRASNVICAECGWMMRWQNWNAIWKRPNSAGCRTCV